MYVVLNPRMGIVTSKYFIFIASLFYVENFCHSQVIKVKRKTNQFNQQKRGVMTTMHCTVVHIC